MYIYFCERIFDLFFIITGLIFIEYLLPYRLNFIPFDMSNMIFFHKAHVSETFEITSIALSNLFPNTIFLGTHRFLLIIKLHD